MALTDKDITPGFAAEVVAQPGGEHLNRC
ncbi:MAG: 4Fe-4S ferredoxin, partial [Deltaproteobacteria bacterium CG_4_10_14_3_um_filter_60_8]